MGKKNRLLNRRNRKRERRSRKSKVWVRSGKFNRHHIVNKCRGGRATLDNMLIMDTERHNAWHFLFKNMSFDEVIELLKRTIRAKAEQAKEVRLKNFSYMEED